MKNDPAANTAKKRLGFDLDDVLLDFSDTLDAYYNATYKAAITRAQHTTFAIEEIWGCSREQAVKIIEDFYRSPEHQNVKPIAGAQEGIRALAESHVLYIVTSKPDWLREQTESWLGKHFPGMFEEVVFTNHFTGEGKRLTKPDVCATLGVSAFVEDMFDNAKNIAASGVPVVLRDTPWNQLPLPPKVERATTWQEIVGKLTKLVS